MKVGEIMTIGDKIRSYRKNLGLTQEELAEKLQTSYQTIYKYEKGVIKNIPLSKISALAVIFGIDPSELTGWTDNTPDAYKKIAANEQKRQETPEFKLNNTEKELIQKYREKPECHNEVHRILGVSERPGDNAFSRPFGAPLFSLEDFNTPLSVLRAASPPLPKLKRSRDED